MLKLTFRYTITDVAREVQLTTRRGGLRYKPELFASVEWIQPNADAWTRFATDVELSGVWNWAPEYYEFTGEEGVFWYLALRDSSRFKESVGYTTFPVTFPLLCGALEMLVGRQLFDDWDHDTIARFHARGPRCVVDLAEIKRRRTVVIDEPDPADPIEDWQDFLDEVKRLPGEGSWIDRHIDTAERMIAEKSGPHRIGEAHGERLA